MEHKRSEDAGLPETSAIGSGHHHLGQARVVLLRAPLRVTADVLDLAHEAVDAATTVVSGTLGAAVNRTGGLLGLRATVPAGRDEGRVVDLAAARASRTGHRAPAHRAAPSPGELR